MPLVAFRSTPRTACTTLKCMKSTHHCPHCGIAVRGECLLFAKSGRRAGSFCSGTLHCPRCNTELHCLPNWLQFGALLIAVLSILVRFTIDATAFPTLSQWLPLLSLCGFFVASMAVVYFPRFRLNDPDEGDPATSS